MSASLVLHRGGELVTEDALGEFKAPEPVGRWFPLSHSSVLSRVKATLAEANLEVKKQTLAIAKDGHRFFGVMDLATTLGDGITLSVGVRNSTDKSLPLGFVAGSRVFCCDNLAFSAELLVRRKHTRHGERHFANDIASAVTKLEAFKRQEVVRIEAMQTTALSDANAESFMLRAFERGIVTTHSLPTVIKEWRKPSFEAFAPRNCWSLFNAFTTALGTKVTSNPHQYAVLTMRLNALMAKELTLPSLAA